MRRLQLLVVDSEAAGLDKPVESATLHTQEREKRMRKNLENRLARFDMVLVSTRFGITGDWMVESENGTKFTFFSTLGRVRQFVEELENSDDWN